MYLRWGTHASMEYDGTVIFYGLAGYGDYPVSDDTPEGSICFLCYADEAYCARWQAWDGWSGDAYSEAR